MDAHALYLWAETDLSAVDAMPGELLVKFRPGVGASAREEVVFTRGEGLVGWIALHAEPLRTGHADRDQLAQDRRGAVDGRVLDQPAQRPVGGLALGRGCGGKRSGAHPHGRG